MVHDPLSILWGGAGEHTDGSGRPLADTGIQLRDERLALVHGTVHFPISTDKEFTRHFYDLVIIGDGDRSVWDG